MGRFINTALCLACFCLIGLVSGTAAAQNSEAALRETREALAASPDDPELLRNHADTAVSIGAYREAVTSYARLLELQPENDEALLALARAESWRGNLDEAASYFESYLERNPNDASAILNRAYNESWRGDYHTAFDILDAYQAAGGDETEFMLARARFLAGAGFSDEAMTIVDEVLRVDPYNTHINITRVLALQESGGIDESLEGLEALASMPGDEVSKAELERIVKTPLRSLVKLEGVYASDSDEIDISTISLEGRYTVNPRFYLWAGIQDGYLTADIGSGLESITGDSKVNVDAGWLGATIGVTDSFWINGRVGESDTDVTDSTDIYRLEFNLRPSDKLNLNLSRDRNFHAVSPRALSLDVTRTYDLLRATWRPNLDYTIDLQAGQADFSDGNSRWDWAVAPRRSLVRKENYNIDLGISARQFSFDKDFNNGYYNPSRYEQYLLTLFYYRKLSPEDGISVVIAPGVQKDSSMSSFESSGNIYIEGTHGLLSDWMLNWWTGWVRNIGINNLKYQRVEAGLGITRRF